MERISFEQINKTSFATKTQTLFEIMKDGVKFEFLVKYRPEYKGAIILGTGAITANVPLPIFSRSTWAEDIPATTIYYFDPTIYDGDANLCWGYGNNDRWYLQEIGDICKIILNDLQITIEDTLFFGSAGGGFMSIMLACMLRSRATVFNPQIFVESFYPSRVKQFKECVLKSGESLIEERVNVVAFIRKEQYCPQIHYVQNIYKKTGINASFDSAKMLSPYLRLVEEYDLLDQGSALKITLYSNVLEHNGLMSKEQTINMMIKDLRTSVFKIDFFYGLNMKADAFFVNDRLKLILKLSNDAPNDLEFSFAFVRFGETFAYSPFAKELEREFDFTEFDHKNTKLICNVRYKGITKQYELPVKTSIEMIKYSYELREMAAICSFP